MKRNMRKFILIYGWVAIFLSLVMLTGCALPWPTLVPQVKSAKSVEIPGFADLVEKVNPGVVAITTENLTYDGYNNTLTQESSGSGWMIDENGTIVTNNHVIDGAAVINVELSDHKAYTAELVSTDPTTDVAVIRINTGQKLLALSVADTSRLKVGDWVIIMGNPLGMGISAKQGIISRLGVTMYSSPEQIYYNLIETSAAVNPGNSGGPMVNMDGEVIGITSLKIESSGIEGMGYAITIEDVMPVIRVLARGQKVIRPWLGASLAPVDGGMAAAFKLDVESGALITCISAGSPADKAELAVGDVIVGFNGQAVASDDDLTRFLNQSRIGETVELAFWRGQDVRTADVDLTEGPPPPPSAGPSPALSPLPSPSSAPLPAP
jgi:serine protease Do